MYLLGIDIGTTGTKAILFSEEGKVIKSSYKGYNLLKKPGGIFEQNAEDWWEALVFTVRECTAGVHDLSNLAALSLSTQGGSLVAVDSNGQPLGAAVSWMDKRCASQSEKLIAIKSQDYYYQRTGFKIARGLNLLQMMWLKENNFEVYQKAYRFLSTVDFLNYRLTGNFVIDQTNAGITLIENIRDKKWDSEIIEIAGLDESRLAEIIDGGKVIGRLKAEAAEALGLSRNVKVISGGHDQYCAAIGAGAVKSGDLLLSTGTAWVLLGMNDKPVFDTNKYLSIGRHAIDGVWGSLASIPSAGASMEWFKENIGNANESLKIVDEKAAPLFGKNKGLMFYPYFNGSAYPDWNEKARSTIVGLGLEHSKYDIALALMEGVVFHMARVIDGYSSLDINTKRIILCGGASKSKLWSRIIANTLNCNVLRTDQADLACVGAAVLAGYGSGLYNSIDQGISNMVQKSVLLETNEQDRLYLKDKLVEYTNIFDKVEILYE